MSVGNPFSFVFMKFSRVFPSRAGKILCIFRVFGEDNKKICGNYRIRHSSLLTQYPKYGILSVELVRAKQKKEKEKEYLMKKRMFHRCIFGLFSLFLAAALLIPSAAQTITEVNAERNAIVSLINSYDDTDTVFSIASGKQLKNVDGEFAYTCYALRPYGYAILRNDNHVLSEACFEENAALPFDLKDPTVYYYVGPTTFATKKDNAIRLDDGTVLTEEVITSIRQTENLLSEREDILGNYGSSSLPERSTAPSVYTRSVHEEYFSKLHSAFGENTEGTCTVVAASILLGFYDVFVHDTYVGDIYRTAATDSQSAGTTEAFHQFLCQYVYGDGSRGGIHISTAASGFNNYLADRGMSIRFESNVTPNVIDTRLKVRSMIDHGHPAIASMGKDYGAEIDHTVVVYGYKVISTSGGGIEFSSVGTNAATTSTTYRVHYGWQNQKSDVWVSSDWFYRYGALGDCTVNGSHIMDLLGYTEDYHSGDRHYYLKKTACSSCGGNVTSTWISFACNGNCAQVAALEPAG